MSPRGPFPSRSDGGSPWNRLHGHLCGGAPSQVDDGPPEVGLGRSTSIGLSRQKRRRCSVSSDLTLSAPEMMFVSERSLSQIVTPP